MANQFTVQPLGGFNLGQGLSNAVNTYQQREQQQQQKAIESEMMNLSKRAATGDSDAVAELYGRNPKLAMMFEERNAENAAKFGEQRAATIKKSTGDFLAQYKGADQEQRKQLLSRAISDPNIDFDEEDAQAVSSGNESILDLGLINSIGLDSYKQLYGGNKNTITEYQKELVKGSNADREIRKVEAENKRIDNKLKRETNRFKLEELKNKRSVNDDKQFRIKKTRSDSAQAVVDSGESTLSLISEIENHPGFSSAVGAKGISSLFGVIDPISGTDAAGVTALIETLEAQNFLTAIGEFKSAGGAGSLSDNEGKKLGAALSNLSTSQSEKDFTKSLGVIRSLVKKQISRATPQIDSQLSKGMTADKDSELLSIDEQAMKWAQANPNDPRSAQILKKLQGKR